MLRGRPSLTYPRLTSCFHLQSQANRSPEPGIPRLTVHLVCTLIKKDGVYKSIEGRSRWIAVGNGLPKISLAS